MSYYSSNQSVHTAYPQCGEPSNSHGMYPQSLTTRTTDIISFLLRKNVERKRSQHQMHFPQQQFDPMTSPNNSYYVECKTSPLCEDSKTTQFITNPLSPSWDQSCLENHQAKRARIENILQRMAGSPPIQVTDEKTVSHLTGYQPWNHSKEMLLPLQDYCYKDKNSPGEDYRTGESPEHLNVLHTNPQKDQMSQVYKKNSKEQRYLGGETALPGVVVNEGGTPLTSHTLQLPDTPVILNIRDDMQYCLNSEWERNKARSSHTSLDNELMDLLKSELSRAVNLSVDLVFRKMSHSLHKTAAQDPGKESEHHLSEENVKFEERTAPRYNLCTEITEPSLPNVQTEALSLVIQKPTKQENSNTLTQVNTSVSETKNPPFQSKHSLNIDQEVLQQLQDGSPNVLDKLSCRYNASQSSVDLLSHSWEPIKVTSKGMSNCMNQQAQLVALSQLAFDNLCFPHIKRENQGVVESNSLLRFHMQEGLTPGHLKKAKLMFFFTRYPNSNVLKTFFPDVKFTRCVTSQLIKWFSNFREFYYIQMEKFARHAVVEGIANVEDITVDRHSELFRVLNTHYNKANDFQVPDRFLEVVEITLREFYTAISQSRDMDPSWKKAIYKVICKLDSDVPAAFKSPLFT